MIARWDSEAVTLDGQPYRNSYVWLLKMEDGRVLEATAFLDLPAYDAVLSTVMPRAARRTDRR